MVIPFWRILGFVLLAQLVPFSKLISQKKKRFSIHPGQKKPSQNYRALHVGILLVGENLPGGMRRLQKSIEETGANLYAYIPSPSNFLLFRSIKSRSKGAREFHSELGGLGINTNQSIL